MRGKRLHEWISLFTLFPRRVDTRTDEPIRSQSSLWMIVTTRPGFLEGERRRQGVQGLQDCVDLPQVSPDGRMISMQSGGRIPSRNRGLK